MAAYSQTMPASMPRPTTYTAPASMAAPAAPAGTFAPGTKIQVGGHKVVIQKYFSEGGFAHVYLVKLPKPIDGTDIAVLKRVAVPDKDALANMRTEVETMKKLKGHRPIVTYYDSHASQMTGGGYEVFLLMEFCNGGGLIDFMNTRLQNRLTEPEILKIFSDVAEGVACMHYLKPPLLHRDLKVENVLITSTGTSKRFKLCDFGSTAPPRPAGTTPSECRLIEDDVQRHTTLQYRSPEMIDVYRKQAIDEKSDIWALGVLLYKLCYYTTPFEEQGQLAILNASFKYPAYPPFSDNLKKLIASMLKEKPQSRPNIYQVLREACLMQGINVPIKDIYSGRTESEARRTQKLPSPDREIASPPTVGAVISNPIQQKQFIPDIAPMRRGRPTTGQVIPEKPSSSPKRSTNSDPFAALDAKVPSAYPPDELADRFPSLDQFALLHDHGKFEFADDLGVSSKPKDLSQRVTERLADDAFSNTSKPADFPPASKTTVPIKVTAPMVSKAQQLISSTPSLQISMSAPAAPIYQPKPSKPVMISQGTMTSINSPSSASLSQKHAPSPIWRVPTEPENHRSSSLPRNESESMSLPGKGSPRLDSAPRTPSHLQASHSRHASSSRPSLEGGRPSADFMDPVPRTKSSNARPRPSSTYVASSMDFLRDKEASSTKPPLFSRRSSTQVKVSPADESTDAGEEHIPSNLEFLRAMEEQDEAAKKDRRRSSGEKLTKPHHQKHVSLSGTKTLLAGRFGDAFKRFETNTGASGGPRTPSPLHDMGRRDLTPIAGSEATDERGDDAEALDDYEGMAPEQRREVERRRLSMEEKRVANAAAEYRQRLADRDSGSAPAPRALGGLSRASAIQNKVQTLLNETQKAAPTKTTEGYGKYTDVTSVSAPPTTSSPFPNPSVSRKPMMPPSPTSSTFAPSSDSMSSSLVYSKPRTNLDQPQSSKPIRGPAHSTSRPVSRPTAPPKPTHLNKVGIGAAASGSPPTTSGGSGSQRLEAHPDMSLKEKEDYIQDFSKRFPSLSGMDLEMVEASVGLDRGPRTKDV